MESFEILNKDRVNSKTWTWNKKKSTENSD